MRLRLFSSSSSLEEIVDEIGEKGGLDSDVWGSISLWDSKPSLLCAVAGVESPTELLLLKRDTTSVPTAAADAIVRMMVFIVEQLLVVATNNKWTAATVIACVTREMTRMPNAKRETKSHMNCERDTTAESDLLSRKKINVGTHTSF